MVPVTSIVVSSIVSITPAKIPVMPLIRITLIAAAIPVVPVIPIMVVVAATRIVAIIAVIPTPVVTIIIAITASYVHTVIIITVVIVLGGCKKHARPDDNAGRLVSLAQQQTGCDRAKP
jgi:hypothetical protein